MYYTTLREMNNETKYVFYQHIANIYIHIYVCVYIKNTTTKKEKRKALVPQESR